MRNFEEVNIRLSETLADLRKRHIEEATQNISTTEKNIQVMSTSLVIFSTVFVTAFSFFMIRSITVPLNQALQMANAIASGNLAIEDIATQSHDELGMLSKALNQMKHSLRNVLNKVTDNSQRVSLSASEIQDIAKRLVTITHEQKESEKRGFRFLCSE